VNVYITHPKPGEVPSVLSQIRALDSRHLIEPLREGQRFGMLAGASPFGQPH
jgi:hypothetical protein